MTFDNDEAPYKSTRPGTWSFQRANWILTRLIPCQILILKKGQKVEKIKIIKVEKIKIIRRTFHYLWILKFTIQPLWKLRPDMKDWKPWIGISTGVSFSSETDIVILGFFSGGEGPSGLFRVGKKPNSPDEPTYLRLFFELLWSSWCNRLRLDKNRLLV